MVHKHLISFFSTILLTAFIVCTSAAFDTDNRDTPNVRIGADSGITLLDEDLFISVLVEFELGVDGFEVVLLAPFRFRVFDNAPSDNGVLRSQDWDDSSDWARIVRTLRFEHHFSHGSLELYAGELNGVHLGHGEIVSHYYNSVDMDAYHGGIKFFADYRGNGIEFLMDDVVDPSIFAGRVVIAPFSWFSSKRLAERFQLGLYFFADRDAPSRTIRYSRSALYSIGADASFMFAETKKAGFSTYVSAGVMDGDAGFHCGLIADVLFSERTQRGMHFQSEFRYSGEDYYPAVVNPYYNYNRRYFTKDPVTGVSNTFTDHLANTSMGAQSGPGFMADIELQPGEKFTMGVRYDYQSRNRPHWMLLRIRLAPTEKISLSVFYAGQDIEGGSKIFSLDALMGVAYHHQIMGPLRFFSEFTRRLRGIDSQDADWANETILGIGLIVNL
ncbi:MAG: hypothetical protein JXR76_31515 [Deltaproteobacteria bacterium]|nr:hypothetical protein [Deltaproteobacteria bacterium]